MLDLCEDSFVGGNKYIDISLRVTQEGIPFPLIADKLLSNHSTFRIWGKAWSNNSLGTIAPRTFQGGAYLLGKHLETLLRV